MNATAAKASSSMSFPSNSESMATSFDTSKRPPSKRADKAVSSVHSATPPQAPILPQPADPSADHFARSVALMSVAHIARGVGFECIQRSAGDAMADILAAYIQRIGVAAKDVAEHAGRSQPRATDVAMALHDMLPAPVDLPDLIQALQTAKRPFPRDIPPFPVRKNDFLSATSALLLDQNKIGNRDELPAYAPRFAPPLPNRHTYSAESRVVVERERDPKRSKLDLLGQKSHVQQSLHGLESAALATSSSNLHSVAAQPAWNAFQGAAANTTDQASRNPYVQPPILHHNGTSKQKFGSVDRAFAPVTTSSSSRDKFNKKHSMSGGGGGSLDTSSSTMAKLNSSQDLGKEEKILTGVFHDGDSE